MKTLIAAVALLPIVVIAVPFFTGDTSHFPPPSDEAKVVCEVNERIRQHDTVGAKRILEAFVCRPETTEADVEYVRSKLGESEEGKQIIDELCRNMKRPGKMGLSGKMEDSSDEGWKADSSESEWKVTNPNYRPGPLQQAAPVAPQPSQQADQDVQSNNQPTSTNGRIGFGLQPGYNSIPGSMPGYAGAVPGGRGR